MSRSTAKSATLKAPGSGAIDHDIVIDVIGQRKFRGYVTPALLGIHRKGLWNDRQATTHTGTVLAEVCLPLRAAAVDASRGGIFLIRGIPNAKSCG